MIEYLIYYKILHFHKNAIYSTTNNHRTYCGVFGGINISFIVSNTSYPHMSTCFLVYLCNTYSFSSRQVSIMHYNCKRFHYLLIWLWPLPPCILMHKRKHKMRTLTSRVIIFPNIFFLHLRSYFTYLLTIVPSFYPLWMDTVYLNCIIVKTVALSDW